MRKRITVWMSIFLAVCLTGCAGNKQQDTAQEENSATEIIEDEYLPTGPGYTTISGYFATAGRKEKGYDAVEFINSEAADKIYQNLYYYSTVGPVNQQDPAVYAYWESIGLEKKIYDASDRDRLWSVFVPAGKEYGEDHRYPVVFCLHGNDNTIFITETYGFAKLGAEEEYITVIPWAKNEDIIVEEIPRILEILRSENYPMDETRIYAVGFSKGGMAVQNVVLAHSDIFAAAAVGGFEPLGIDNSASPITSGTLNWSFRPEEFEQANTTPVMFFGGSCDSMPVDTTSVNAWINLSGAIAPEMKDTWFAEFPENTENDTERLTGLRFTQEQTEIRQYDGQNYYIGSYTNEEGVCTFRAVSVEGAPHWVMPSEPVVVWEFLSRFARDTQSHELMITE